MPRSDPQEMIRAPRSQSGEDAKERTGGPSREWAQAEQLRYIIPFVESKGFRWIDIARKFDLPARPEKLKNERIEAAVLLAAFEHVAELTGDDAAMLDYYSGLPHGSIPIFDYVALCAGSVRDGLKNWERFIAIRTNCYRMEFTEDADFGYLTWHIPDRLGPRTQNMFAKIAWATSRIEHMIGQPTPELRIDLTSTAPRCGSCFQHRYGNRLKFGQPYDRILIPVRFLDLRPPKSETNLYSIVESAALAEIDEANALNDPLIKVKTVIGEQMKSGTCTLETVAAQIGKSQRSLQRLLEENGTSFRGLTDDIRRTMASRYLKETDLGLKEIAFLLGFSNLSSLSRAVRGWFDMTPSEVRREARTRTRRER
ncbi:hypothetical protein GCM10011316_20900 [Roseibium aquae]|uniref:HTH araC/xylS-type domain-containing protein n=1 Tax=Roseibium aquae TaxID=1323746 RepID=A0A916TK49_9HYPH|nr:AraC family transcriptional regulator [Roseibium aquae]GGB48617.1 hypothetical protein GCM10011316_20900 [Roseibium aquae]